jgi:hypothetical protein
MKNAQYAAEDAIRAFAWDDYGLDGIDIGLHDDPDAQEWVTPLAQAVLRAVLLHINYGSSIGVNDVIGPAGYE